MTQIKRKDQVINMFRNVSRVCRFVEQLVIAGRIDCQSPVQVGIVHVAVGGCAGLPVLLASSSSLPFLLSWRPSSPLGVG